MSVKSRIGELNARLATKLTARGVTASEDETTTALINKVDDIPEGGGIDWSQCTDWRYFSYNNNRNDLVAKLKYSDTANGTNFGSMFNNCTALTSIPKIDTSKGTDFSGIFRVCSSLTSVPQLDTSKGTKFYSMFYSCSSLTSVPQFDTSSGTNFGYMFSGCRALTSVPQLDTSKGTDFSYMFSGCSSLTSVPQLDTSKCTNFNGMFSNCSSLTSVPQFDTSSGTNFGYMFSGCRALITIPLLNMSSMGSTNWSSTFESCTTLENVTFEGIIPVRGNMSVFSFCPNLTVESLMSFINALTNMSSSSTYKITIGSTNLAKLTQEQIQIATDKRITLQ